MSPDTIALALSGLLFAFFAMAVTARDNVLSQITIKYLPFVLAIADLGIVLKHLLV